MWFPERYRQRHPGFTLIEVLVALTILSVGVLGLLGALLASSKACARSEHLDTAVILANTKLEQAICVTTDKLQSEDGQEDRFTYAVSIENRSGDLLMAKVTVQWLEGGDVQEYTLSKVFLPVAPPEEEDE